MSTGCANSPHTLRIATGTPAGLRPGLIGLCLLLLEAAAHGSEPSAPPPPLSVPPPAWQEELHFKYRADWRLYPEQTWLDESTAQQLPGILLPPSQSEVSNLRLDLRAAPCEALDLELKPRHHLAYQEWQQGSRAGEEKWNGTTYLNGWLIQVHPWDQLAVAYAREDQAWGPSYLVSPSNPFRNSNGRNLPQIEQPGMDFIKAIWTPSTRYSFSALANPDDGRANPPPLAAAGAPPEVLRALHFQPTYALKGDVTAEDCTFSLIGSLNEQQERRLGGYTSWNVSDAVLAYGEAGAGPGGDLDYLLGSSYTFAHGGTLAAEYFHNGINREEAAADVARLTATTGPYMGFLNHDYTLLQYRQGDIFQRVELVLRWIHALDDSSDRLAGEIEYALNDHACWFVDGVLDLGLAQDEFGLLVQSILLTGLRLTY
jgi:hypothetical protein